MTTATGHCPGGARRALEGQCLAIPTCLSNKTKLFLKILAKPGLFFVNFWSVQTNITIFTTILCEKNSIEYMVPGFEPTTFGTCVSSHNH